jgi:triosephosphate isomerase (TIM)
MRTNIIAGNWKMNKTLLETATLCTEIMKEVKGVTGVEIVLSPPFVNLEKASNIVNGTSIKISAQNMYYETSGAYTGEVSGAMLKGVGCEYVILGHSERRAYFEESDEIINLKLKAAFDSSLVPIVCVGERLDEREAGKAFEVVEKQLTGSLKEISQYILDKGLDIVIAYEPVWAIGTGKVATPEQAQEMHGFIRDKLVSMFGQAKAGEIRILYGGSVKPDNITELIKNVDIDGALVGGASLKVESFVKIIQGAKEI